MLIKGEKYSIGEVAVGVTLLVGIFATVWLGVAWLLWQLWCFVATSFFPDAGPAITSPGYWQFCALWLLLVSVASLFRSNITKGK